MKATASFFPDDFFEKMTDQVKREFATKPQVAFLGRTGAGKTQLLSRLSGRTDRVTESTREQSRTDLLGCEMLDNVGAGSFHATAADMIEHGRKADVVVYLVNGMDAPHDDDVRVIHALRKYGRPVIVTITKVDKWDEQDRNIFLSKLEAKLDLPHTEFSLISSTKDIGLLELGERIRGNLPEKLRKVFVAMIGLQELKHRQCESEILGSAGLAAAIGAIPIPISDIFLLTPLQARLVLRIGIIYGYEMTLGRAKEVTAVVGAGVLLRTLGGSLAKLIPGVGSLIAAGIAAAGTYALGRVAVAYFESGMSMTDEQIGTAFKSEYDNARARDVGKELIDQVEPAKLDVIKDLERRHKKGELTDEQFREEINRLFFPE